MRHKWANEIISWANGDPIQERGCGHDWVDAIYPEWHRQDLEFRVKPRLVKKWQWAYKVGDDAWWSITPWFSQEFTIDKLDNLSRIFGCDVQAIKLEFTEIQE